MAHLEVPSAGFLDPRSLKSPHQGSYTGTTLHEDDPFFQHFSEHVASSSSASTPPPAVPRPTARPARPYPRISLPLELMRSSYDVVVIGTGYGGSVAASRMARGRQAVCVLERGLERWPGEYPEQLKDAAKEIRVSGEFAPGDRRSIPGKVVGGGNPTGLYHYVMGDGQNAFVGNGLGGGSLVNANVFIEATPEVLDMEVWPEELRGEEQWSKYYDRAASVLEPVRYPSTHPELAKANLLQKQAELLNQKENFYRVRQTTRFHDGPNSTGVPMKASTLTGMDATGINDGSKSTTLVNYLSDAWNWGAEMFCECEVRYVAKAPDREGYIVYFSWHGSRRDRFSGFHEDLMWVHAKKFVFFGAGSLGTTEILLRSKQFGLPVSDDLGTEMSGNGDMLGFGYNTDFDANCIAQPVTDPKRPVGPCITSVLDMRRHDNPLSGFVVQDCAVPYALAPLMYPMLEFLPDPNKPDYGAAQAAAKSISRAFSRLFGAHHIDGSVAKTAVYLIMSHDSSQGSLTLRKDKPVLTYSGVGRSDSVSRIHEFLEEMTAAVGGNFIANPAWTALGAHQITVHAIGGARISADGTGKKGVVNHNGEVFTGKGTDIHSGLVVCDGSMIPAAVGVNPFATITALAERSVEMVADKNGITIDYKTKNGTLDMFGSPAWPLPRDETMNILENTLLESEREKYRTLGFSEVMSGFIHAGPDVGEFEAATKLARSQCEAARVFLDVKSWNVPQMLNDELHAANLAGTFMCSALGGTFSIQRGRFQLFSKDEREPEATNMVYDFDMESISGRKLHFRGTKVINSAAFMRPWRLWGQTTTLYVVITDDLGKVVGRGTLYVLLRDFLRQILTFEITAPSQLGKVGVAAGFVGFFTKQVMRPLFSTLGRLQWPGPIVGSEFDASQPSQTIELEASDGVKSTMLMWNPLDKRGRETTSTATPILFVPGAAVDHRIFALPTIKENAISFFRKAGYRAYCVTHRVGRTPEAQNGHTPYDARLDIHAALRRIRELESERSGQEPQKIYIVAHCAGSSALSCGLLDGTIPGEWIKGITASMVFMHPKFGKINHLLSGFPADLYSRLISPWWDCSSTPDDTLIQRFMNQLLRLYPAGSARETCRSVVCHRSSMVFGRLWTHANLNEETHANLEHFVGGTSMRSLAWLMNAGSKEHVTTNEPESTDLVTPENIERLKGIPILFLSGTGNMVFTAENTDRSYTTLCHAHGRKWYQREVFQGKGHLDAWMSASAHEDVYPRVLSHVEEVMTMQ